MNILACLLLPITLIEASNEEIMKSASNLLTLVQEEPPKFNLIETASKPLKDSLLFIKVEGYKYNYQEKDRSSLEEIISKLKNLEKIKIRPSLYRLALGLIKPHYIIARLQTGEFKVKKPFFEVVQMVKDELKDLQSLDPPQHSILKVIAEDIIGWCINVITQPKMIKSNEGKSLKGLSLDKKYELQLSAIDFLKENNGLEEGFVEDLKTEVEYRKTKELNAEANAPMTKKFLECLSNGFENSQCVLVHSGKTPFEEELEKLSKVINPKSEYTLIWEQLRYVIKLLKSESEGLQHLFSAPLAKLSDNFDIYWT